MNNKRFSFILVLVLLINAVFAISAVFAETYDIVLKAGKNLVALPHNFADSNPCAVFNSSVAQIESVWSYDSCDSFDPWKVYKPGLYEYSDLKQILPYEGYLVNVKFDTTLQVKGTSALACKVTFNFKKGWNLISWPFAGQTVTQALFPLIFGRDYDQVSRFNSITQQEENFVNQSGDKFTAFEYGQAYYIHALKDAIVVVGFGCSMVNQPPEIVSISNKTIKQGQTLQFTVSAIDLDSGNSLNYAAVNLPQNAQFDPSSGEFSWTPAANQIGTHKITFSVSDGVSVHSQTIAITVLLPVPSAPQGLIALPADAKVDLKWYSNPEPNAAGYNVYREDVSGDPYIKVNISLVAHPVGGQPGSGNPVTYADTGLTNGTAYYYVVTAVDDVGGESVYSKQVQAKPMAHDSTAPRIFNLVPANSTASSNDKLVISAEFDDDHSGVDVATVKITLDGYDVTVTSVITATGVSYIPAIVLTEGLHTVTVNLKDIAGNSASQSLWSFTIDAGTPFISAVLPVPDTVILAGTKAKLQISAVSFDSSPLEYQFSIGGTIKQAWSLSRVYEWQTVSSDAGSIDVLFEGRDNQNRVDSRTAGYHVIDPTAQEVLERIKDNYSRIEDFQCKAVLNTVLDLQPLGETGYCFYYYKKPGKEKLETYSDSQRATKTDIMIIDGFTMHLVNPGTKAVQSVDMLERVGVSAGQFSQMDLYYNPDKFIEGHNVHRVDGDTDLTKAILALEALPKTANPLYTKILLLVNYDKGIIAGYSLYKDDSLVEIMEVRETMFTSTGTFLPIRIVKRPMLTSGNMETTLVYSDLKVNVGLTDADFAPEKQ